MLIKVKIRIKNIKIREIGIKLLENLKSINIIKSIMLNLDENIKLKAIKFNKNIQNIININLINYKFFSEKYIEYETKREVKK